MSRSQPAAVVAGALSLFTLCPWARAQEPGDKEVAVSGKVVTVEGEIPLAGARLELLKDGVDLVVAGETDSQGHYSIRFLPEERSSLDRVVTYDLRAISGHQQYLAAFARDLVLDEGGSHIIDFDLVSVEDALFELDIELEDLTDTDGDHVPDALEGPTRLDEDLYDTNEDGQPDGLSVWVGANPLLGPVRTEEVPGVLWPPQDTPGGVRFPMLINGVTPPFGMLFRAVTSATGYRVTARAKSGRVERSWDYDCIDGELLLGSGGLSMRWMPPAGWEPGAYEIIIQGYYGLPDELVGLESRYELELFELDGTEDSDELEEIEIVEEQSLFGLVVCSSLVVRERARLLVPPGETLYLVATGDVTIEHDAELIGAEGTTGASVVISAGGNIIIHGSVTAGAGLKGEDDEESAKSGEPSIARAQDGARGGDAMFFALGEVVISSEGRLASGDGGEGGLAEATAGVGQDAQALGGKGGTGGRFVLHASTTRIADRPGILTSGAGGRGGDGKARGGDGTTDEQAGLSSALPGAGGSAGAVWLSDWDLRRDGYVALADESFPLKGGIAGAPGEALPTYGSPGATSGARSFEGRSHEVIRKERGGSGWYRGGTGLPAIARGGEGLQSGDGGSATANGGPGGTVSRPGIPYTAFELIFGYLPVGGEGGLARATGGLPGPGGLRDPGEGGGASATAGLAGAGLVKPLALFSRGGKGGDAWALGQDGRNGANRCPGRGQDGSDGGRGEAIAAAGGYANYRGGAGGLATAQSGSGGSGGMGHGGGMAGSAGHLRAAKGAKGLGLAYEGTVGEGQATRGMRGMRGATCPN